MLWPKALHLIFMVTWFAGLFYLPRLYVYHAQCEDEISNERFKIMERKLFFGIMTPGAILTCGMGGWMLYDYAWVAWGEQLWLQAKLAVIAATLVYHLWCGKLLLEFRRDANQHSHVYFRWFNEIPVIFLVVIVLLAVLRP
ncbi:MAG TPA: CopD family protein [Chromatiaceae bacterium]|jgi:putative membrane protein|nr:CopD family protein [Chromatiaceae bacterium]HIA08956.1 CopD family protein [Chromatiaceae bacterium]HIN83175.1 CopD family protein [Chromatiales bacterium]HIO13697.1 CopD family protein [Chromatiales bacterium]